MGGWAGDGVPAGNAGSSNTFIGGAAGAYFQSGTNTCIGDAAGLGAVPTGGTAGARTGTHNTFIGADAGFYGHGAGASENTLIGTYAGAHLGDGKKNTFIGSYSGAWAYESNRNTFIGSSSGSSSSGHSNIFVGFWSSSGNIEKSFNTSFGYVSGPMRTNLAVDQGQGSFSIYLGVKSGNYIADSRGDILVGYEAGQYAGNPNDWSNNVVVGNYAMTSNNPGSNSLMNQGEYIHRIAYGSFDYVYTSVCQPGTPPPPWPCPYSSSSSACQCFPSPQAIGTTQTSDDPCGGAGPNLQYCYAEEGDPPGVTHALGCSGGAFPRSPINECPVYPATSSTTVAGTRLNTSPEPRTDCPFVGTSYLGSSTQVFGLNARMWCCGCRYDRSVITSPLNTDVTIVGHEAGKDSCGQVVAIGYQAGQECQPGFSFYIGSQAGSNNIGEGNMFIGHEAGTNDSTINHTFIVGNSTTPRWMHGELLGNLGKLYVNGNVVVVSSSRSLKTDITLFEDYEQVLEDIVETPLFTYKYKHPQDFPNKTRWGVISEELPDHLQLIQEDQPSHPDWPSIYGSFWGSIKALYQRITSLSQALEEFGAQFKSHEQLMDLIFDVQQEMVEFKREALFQMSKLSRQIYNFISQEDKYLEQARLQLNDIRNIKSELQDQLTKVEERLQNLENSQK